MSTLKVNELRHLSNSGTANLVLESNATTNLQVTSTLGLTVNGTLTVSGVSTFNGNVVVGNASTDTLALTSTVSGSANFSGFTGEIRMYAGNAAGNSAPAGWLYCNGDTINNTADTSPNHHNSDGTGNDYQPLYNLLKASADWGNTGSLTWGTNNVKLPDFRSRSPIGVHTGAATSITAGLTQRTLSDTAGTETHTMITAEMPTHNHTVTAASANTSVTVNAHLHAGPDHTHSMSFNTGGENVGHQHHTQYLHGRSGVTNTSVAVGGDDQGTTYGRETGSVNLSGHHHLVSGSTAQAGSGNTSSVVAGITDPGHTHSMTCANEGSGNAHTILSPIIAVHYIIKV